MSTGKRTLAAALRSSDDVQAVNLPETIGYFVQISLDDFDRKRNEIMETATDGTWENADEETTDLFHDFFRIVMKAANWAAFADFLDALEAQHRRALYAGANCLSSKKKIFGIYTPSFREAVPRIMEDGEVVWMKYPSLVFNPETDFYYAAGLSVEAREFMQQCWNDHCLYIDLEMELRDPEESFIAQFVAQRGPLFGFDQ
ncbi:hypothetical protein CC2G_012343 [Coprinopsis cinerea AmutBmut pab1-1]|nr:hypothetical protein CC2G_012343 [Coprinopsis cinerea AmutBmut pab1-1]